MQDLLLQNVDPGASSGDPGEDARHPDTSHRSHCGRPASELPRAGGGGARAGRIRHGGRTSAVRARPSGGGGRAAAILESIQSDLEVAANRRFIDAVDMKREELFADEDDKEEAPEFHPPANDHEASGSGKEVIDISDDE